MFYTFIKKFGCATTEEKKKQDSKSRESLAPVAHAYNPSYSGVRDQEDHGSKPARANSLLDPILKIPNPKQAWKSVSNGTVPA
jgi:hypothetical protein